ncbi:hypothetical protein Thiowin_02289 [Thiorhodovibrio winogradskyi]|uniref:DUF4351 domain-containing protein n=1 Tax=Thiorhodovibrio winogradskyi TaxID=77007 RepID=A0ABZ0S8E5_9GAMM|nr:hypothetical protein [Thiorhodovibrio winogradskyi]
MTADTQATDTSDKPDYDSPWKEALERFFPEFLALLFPAIHAQIDWSVAPEFLDKELQQIGGNSPRGRRYADKLVRVRAKDGSDLYVLIHVEVQGDAESDFSARMFLYQTRLRDRYNIDVVSLAVLTDTSPSFRPKSFRHARWGCGIVFRFPMVKLLDYAEPERWAELEASDNVFALVVMAQIRAKVTDDAETLKRWKFRLMRLMYDRGHERALIEEVLRLIDWMIRLPAALEAELRQELYAYEEQYHMPYVTTFEQAGIEKGKILGMELGVQQGEANILMAQLQEKFGADSLDAHRERISTAAPEELLQWSKRILRADSPETIFQ